MKITIMNTIMTISMPRYHSSVDADVLGLSVSTYYDDDVRSLSRQQAARYLGVRFVDHSDALGDPMDPAPPSAIYNATTAGEFNTAVEAGLAIGQFHPLVSCLK